MADKKIQYTLAFTADTKQAKAQLASLQNQLTGLINSAAKGSGSNILSKDIQEASAAAAQLKAQLLGATNVNTGKLDLTKFSRSLKASGMELKDYRDALLTLGPQGAQTFANLASSITQAEVPLLSMNAKIRELGTTLANTVKWQISSSAVHAFMGTIQGAYGYAQDLNKSLNDIQIVTGQSSDEMARFAKQANNAAKALSTSTIKYTEAALIYYQQGLTDEQVKARTDTTIKMANVTGENAADVSSYMTAIWNNFAKGSDNLEYFSDVITALGAATAASSEEIAGGLEKFAAVGETVGLSYEYATAALTTIIDKTRQSEDVVGTALKTIFARIQGLQQGDTAEDGVTLNKYSNALANVGIQIMDTSGELKAMDKILDELGQRWQTLSKAEQVALAQTVGGIRQYTQLIALMDNWGAMQENLNTAYNSEGALQEQADIYAESWEAAQKRVTAALQDIYDSLLNDKFFIGLSNMFASILELLGNLIDSMGGAAGLISLIGVIGVKAFGTQLAGGLQKTINFFKNGTNAAKSMREEAIKLVSTMHSGMANAEGFEAANAYRSQALAQQEFLNATKNLNEEQRKTVQILLDQHSILVQNALEESKRAEELGEVSNQAIRKEDAERRAKRKKQLDNAKNENKKQKLQEKFDTEDSQRRKYQQEIQENAYNKSFINNSIGKFRYDKNGEIEDAKSWMEGFKKNYGFDTDGKAVDPFKNFKDTSGNLANDTLIQKLKDLNNAITNGGDINKAAQDIEDYGAALNKLPSNATPAEQAMHDYAEAQAKAGTKSIEAAVGIDTIKDKLGKFTQVAATAADKAIQAAGGLASIAGGLSSIMSLGDTWSEDNDASIFSKLLSSITTLGFALPMVSGGLKSLAVSLAGVTAEGLTTTGAISALWTKALLPLLSNPITWAIIGIAGALTLVYLEATKEERALKKANEELEKSKKAADDASAAYNDLKSSIDSLESAQNTLSNLTKGTLEWKEAILKVNQQVLDLIEKYPELAQYMTTDSDGVLGFKEGALDTVLQQQLNEATATQAAVLSDQRNLAELKNSQKNKLNNITFTTSDQYSQSTKTLDTNAQIAMLNNAEKVGAFDGEKIDFYKLAKEMPDLYSDFLLYQNAINDTVPDILAMREAIKQTDLEMQKMDENIAKNWLASHETGYDDDYNNLLASGMSKYIGDARTSISQQMTNNPSELKEAYAKLMLGEGASESSIQDYIKKIDEKIKNDELNIETIKETLIDTAANYQAFKQVEGNISAISSFENVDGYETLKKIAISGGSEAAYNAMSPDELKEFKSSFFEGEKLKEDVAKLFNENPQIFGENFASQLQNALNDPEYADKAKINQEKIFSQKAEQKAAGLGVDADALEAYAKNLQDINPLLKDNADAALDAAEANIKWNNGIEKLSEVLDDNAEALKKSNKGTWDYYEALGKVQDAASDLLGIDVSIVYTEKHLSDLQKAVKGDEEAIRKLQQTAAVDWAGEFVKGLQDVGKEGEKGFFDADAWTEQFTSIVDEAANILGGLDTNVELTADANGVLSAADESVAAMVNLANEAMAAGQMTEAEMREMFGSMGYSPEVTYEDAQQTTTTHGTFRLGGELIGMDIPYSNTVVQDIKVPKIADKNSDGKTSLTKITTPKSLAKTATPKGKTSGGSSKKDKKNADDEIERYHEIRETIQSLEKELDRLSKAKDRAYGQDKLDLMDKEIAKVEELKSAQEEYLKQIRANYNKDKAAAAAIGAQFDEQGNISNWDEIRKQALDKFNNSGRTDKDEEEYNRIKEILDQYEETHDLLMEEEDKLDDYINQIMDMKIAKIQYKVEAKVDIEEKELEYLDYLLSKLEDEEFAAAETMALLGQQTQSWLDKYKANVEGLYDTINKLGISLDDAIGIMTGKYTKEEIDALGLTEEQLKTIRDYGTEFINIAQALDQLKDSFTQELIDAIHEGADAYAQLGEEINHVTSTLQHYQNLIDILGEEALGVGAEQVAELMQSTVDSSIANLANSQKSLEWLKSERERLTAALEGASDAEKESINKALEDLDDQIRSAESQAQSDLESVLNMIVEQFTLHVKQATDAFEKAMSGTFGSLDKLQEAFDRQKELDDLYIDDYKKVYELTKLTRDIGKSIDETDNLKAKQALRDLQKEINDLQKDGVQLSEYDIDMLNKKYELQLAQIALEEAQNAKSQVRMTRDSEGNWSYTYTADENSIAEAEQNYEDKLYAMQELNQEYLKNLQGQILAAQAAMSQAIRDLGPNAGPEEVAAITQHYQAIIDTHSQQMQNALGDSNYALGFMTEETEGWVNSFDETTLSTLTGFESLESYQAAFAQSTQQMADDIGKAFETYNINVDKAMETAGLSVEGFGETLGEVQEQAKEDLEEIAKDSELLSKDVTKNVGDALAQLQGFYDAYGASVESATGETWGLVEALKALSEAQAQQDQEKPDDKPKDQKPEQDSSKPTWEKVKSAYDKINSGAWGTGHQRIVDGKADGFTEAEISLAQKLINKVYGGMSLSDAKKALGFATGGYTGAWGSSGKLAMLHEKELVLNADDTENMLKTINMVRDISNLIDLNAANSMFSTLTTMAMPVGNQGITQEITINAEFPDATDRDEISAAFDSLFIRASQYANRKIK